MSDAALYVGFVTLIFLLAGSVKGVLGVGLPTVAMGLLVAVMPPAQAAAILVVGLVALGGTMLVRSLGQAFA